MKNILFVSFVVFCYACGQPQDNAKLFVGMWNVQSGSSTIDCGSLGTLTTNYAPYSYSIVFSEINDTALTETTNPISCSWAWNVNGNEATMVLPAIGCTSYGTDSSGYQATYYDMDSASIWGNTLTETLSGNISIIDQGVYYTCSFTGNIVLDK